MAAFTIRDARRLSHAYILSSSRQEDCLALAGQIAAAAVCQRETDAPCGQCRACRKARSGNHPDIIHVRRLSDSKGQPRRELLVEQIRQMAADAYVLPNEAARKVYIVEDADKMNPAAQNAALKTLEEPPAGVIFLLCAENPGLLLPTVRSRCVELRSNGEADGEDEDAYRLSVTVTNEGGMAGTEKAQVYAKYTDSRTVTPNFQLCGLKAIELEPGESARVTFDIPKYWVSAVLEDGTRTAPDGELAFYLGGSQPDERSLELTGTACRKVVLR